MKPITIITGFLGSGKTTLLNAILKQNHGKRIAVIENELGEKNIDYEFVLHEKEQIYQMTNGCICCSVREDLVKTMHEIHSFGDKFDAIIIETTGVADPSPVLHTLKQDQILRENYQLDSIICLIDAKNFLKQFNRSPEVKKQLTAANLVLLNKTDLVNETEIDEIENKIKYYNLEAEVIKTKYSEINLDQVFLRFLFKAPSSVPLFIAKAKNNIFSNQSPKGVHDENISSKFFEFSGEMNPQYFSVWVDLLFFQCDENLYRMKGILNFQNENKKVLFQCVHDYLELTKGEEWNALDRFNQFVVIGKDLDFKMIEAGFQSCVR